MIIPTQSVKFLLLTNLLIGGITSSNTPLMKTNKADKMMTGYLRRTNASAWTSQGHITASPLPDAEKDNNDLLREPHEHEDTDTTRQLLADQFRQVGSFFKSGDYTAGTYGNQSVDGFGSHHTGYASGNTIALSNDGKIMVVGAKDGRDSNNVSVGYVKVFDNINDTWVQKGNTVFGDTPSFGWSVALSGNGLVFAATSPAYYTSTTPELKVYHFINDQWLQRGGSFVGTSDQDDCIIGVDLSEDGNILAFGNPTKNTRRGYVRIYRFLSSTNTWSKVGGDIWGKQTHSFFGNYIALSSDGYTLASSNGGYMAYTGCILVYKFINSNWTQISNDNTLRGMNGGRLLHVTLSGDGQIVAGGHFNNSNNNNNKVLVWRYNEGTSWSPVGTGIQKSGVSFGTALDLVALSRDGSLLLVSFSSVCKSSGLSNCGYASMYQVDNTGLTQLGQDIQSQTSNDYMGTGMAISGDGYTIALGSKITGVGVYTTLEAPSTMPSQHPSYHPSDKPSVIPSHSPSFNPSFLPSNLPTLKPSVFPSTQPSTKPTDLSMQPSNVPTMTMTQYPSKTSDISLTPSFRPSNSVRPTNSPSKSPSTANDKSSIPSGTPTESKAESSTKPSMIRLVEENTTLFIAFSASTAELTSLSDDTLNNIANGIGQYLKQVINVESVLVELDRYESSSSLEDGNRRLQNEVMMGAVKFVANVQTITTVLNSSDMSVKVNDVFRSDAVALTNTIIESAGGLLNSLSGFIASLEDIHPSTVPSRAPSWSPSSMPSLTPSVIPSSSPSVLPSLSPSLEPSIYPTIAPSQVPTRYPSIEPSDNVLSVKPSSTRYDDYSNVQFDEVTSKYPTLTPSVDQNVSPTGGSTTNNLSNNSLEPTVIPSQEMSSTIIPPAAAAGIAASSAAAASSSSSSSSAAASASATSSTGNGNNVMATRKGLTSDDPVSVKTNTSSSASSQEHDLKNVNKNDQVGHKNAPSDKMNSHVTKISATAHDMRNVDRCKNNDDGEKEAGSIAEDDIEMNRGSQGGDSNTKSTSDSVSELDEVQYNTVQQNPENTNGSSLQSDYEENSPERSTNEANSSGGDDIEHVESDDKALESRSDSIRSESRTVMTSEETEVFDGNNKNGSPQRSQDHQVNESVRVEGGTATLSNNSTNESKGTESRQSDEEKGENDNTIKTESPSEMGVFDMLTVAEGGLEDGYDSCWRVKYGDYIADLMKKAGSSTSTVGSSFAVCVALSKLILDSSAGASS